ncbi:MAG: DUF3108 domain-containing protein [Campylobacterales bacterium]|nr:DUF3108 domain-containing protein [Campylobacterales bacterium]
MRLILGVLFLVSSLFSSTVTSKFKVTFGFIGEIGNADAVLVIQDNKYKISVVAKSTGMAKLLSGNKQESYTSEGVVENGFFKPLIHKSIVNSNSKKVEDIYDFNYEKKQITKKRISLNKENNEEKIENSVEDFFTDNDVLTLFFNLGNYIDELKEKKSITRLAVGANKNDRIVYIEILNEKERESVQDLMKMTKENTYLKVVINQDIFSSDKGELLLSLDRELYCNKAVLKDVLFFGDIVGAQTSKIAAQ